MDELEKNIEIAALQFWRDNFDVESGREHGSESSFIAGAMSEEAKEYWQKGMWNNEEVLNLLYLAFGDKCYSQKRIKEWFENNKK